jgi:hypothetical protein
VRGQPCNAWQTARYRIATYSVGVTQWGLEAIFNPGKRFDDDERKHLEATREEAGDASGGRRIDLGSGKVVIAKKDAGEDSDADTKTSGSEPTGSELAGSLSGGSGKKASTTQEKAAAAREARIAERQAAAASTGRRGRRKR